MSDRSRVLVAIRVDAAPEPTFAAFTQRIGEWWRPNSLFQFRNGHRGTLAFEPGPNGRLVERYTDGEQFVVGEITEWSPPQRLVMTWRQAGFAPEQATELHVRFEPVGNQTRVTVEHFGWDTIPQEHVARHGFPLHITQQRWAEWWQAQLTSLNGWCQPFTSSGRG
jgi:uncharacterized protein YndB with AHSA1/START domain